jgi:hypothetical protein
MSDLLNVQAMLQDTMAALQHARKMLADDPADQEFSLVLRSLEHRSSMLEAEFASEANSIGMDVCKYRLLRSENQFPASAFADSIKSWQNCLTVFYDALLNGPKKASRSSAEVVQQTTLDVGYFFPGSLGVAFTISNERLLIDSGLDDAVQTIFSTLKVNTPAELLEFSRRLGPAPIRKLHEWAANNLKSGIATDIEWRRNEENRLGSLFQPEEAARLVKIIEDTKPEETEPLSVEGMLIGGDLKKRSFHLVVPDAEDIEGYLAENFVPPMEGELVLNHRYRAELVRHTILHLATESETVFWELLSLVPA